MKWDDDFAVLRNYVFLVPYNEMKFLTSQTLQLVIK